MDPNSSIVLHTFLILWTVGWGALLVSIWVLSELQNIKNDEKRISQLEQHAKEMENRIDSIEKFLVRSGYFPPNKK